MRKLIPFLASVLAVCAMGGPVRADEATETRLREALRQATSQQRTLEDSQSQLQAKLSDQQKQIAALQAQLAQQQAQPVPARQSQPDARAELDRIVAEANQKIAAQNAALVEAGQNAEKWRVGYEQAASVARGREAERARLASVAEEQLRRADSCTTRNTALFNVGKEILDHLKAISVTEAMAAHEPFVGLKRVELQNLAQDDEDKLREQRLPSAGQQATAHQASAPRQPQ